jgi:hypothetical protein
MGKQKCRVYIETVATGQGDVQCTHTNKINETVSSKLIIYVEYNGELLL